MNSKAAIKHVLDTDLFYKTLLESTLAIPWCIDWESKLYLYVGPQIEGLLGWKQETWQSVQDWADRIHEDERNDVVNMCVSQSLAGIDHKADYRALKADGTYCWVREYVHVIRDHSGHVEALVGFIFDISKEKEKEIRLYQLQRKLETYSYKDGLTGIANRRLFDEFYHREWQSAVRDHKPLSIMLVDIDFFKQYNDYHGHVIGDTCIQQIAQFLEVNCSRPRDLVARYGGEEFALVLPETNLEEAAKLAQNILRTIQDAKMLHRASAISDHVTVSIGVKTVYPHQSLDKLIFLDQVDRNLYHAKRHGRNRVVADEFNANSSIQSL